MEGNDGGRLEAAGDFPNGIILGNLQDIKDALDTALGGIEGEAIGKDGEDEGMEDAAPVGIVETLDRVSKNAEATYGRLSAVGHDCHVVFPLEFVVDENAKVADHIRVVNSVVAESV